MSSFSTDIDVQIISKTFITPSIFKALQMTTSLQGITSKDLIGESSMPATLYTASWALTC